MMKTYVNNYWSMYVDFINDFNSLVYRGFTLSYIFQFPTLIRHNQEVWRSLNDENFRDNLKSNIQHEKEVQAIFDQYLNKYQNKIQSNVLDGKVLVFDDNILRFPPKTFNDYFSRTKTLILLRNDQIKEKYGIPIVNLNKYSRPTNVAITKLRAEAKHLFHRYRNHYLYSDKTFQAVLLRKIADVVNCIEECTNILKNVAISCIVVSGSQSFISRILSFAAAKKGIPTICMQHGIIANGFGYLPKICTINAVYGNFEVDWYVNRGCSEDALAIIGHPRFDQVFQYNSISRSTFHERLALDPNKKTILLVVRGERDVVKWRIIIEHITKNTDAQLIIRDFPSTEPHLLTKEFPTVQSTDAMHLYDILPNVDGVISYPSTVGLEAMLLKKPTFILKKRIPNDTGYFELLDSFAQKDPIQLAELVIQFLQDDRIKKLQHKQMKQFLRYAYSKKTMSGQRLKKLIHQLTRK